MCAPVPPQAEPPAFADVVLYDVVIDTSGYDAGVKVRMRMSVVNGRLLPIALVEPEMDVQATGDLTRIDR